MSFVPKVISGGKTGRRRSTRRAQRKLGYSELIDINRLSQAFFRIQSNESRQKIIALIEDIAETERLHDGL